MRIILLFCLTFVVPLSYATSVFSVSLDRMAQKAHLIFHGKVISNEVRVDSSGQIATYTEFKVMESVKGNIGSTHTIKQVGGRVPGREWQFEIQGVPKFFVGQEVVVFLPRPSRTGFSSPIGLSQGRFAIRDTLQGKMVGNGRTVDKLITKSAIAAKAINLKSVPGRPDKAKLEDFLNTVRRLAAP